MEAVQARDPRLNPDSLFKAIAKGLNELPENQKSGREVHTVESLRRDVFEYVQARHNLADLPGGMIPGKKPDGTAMNREYYLAHSELRKISPDNWRKRVIDPDRLPGLHYFEGAILCKKYNIGIHLVFQGPAGASADHVIITPFEENSEQTSGNARPKYVRANRTLHIAHQTSYQLEDDNQIEIQKYIFMSGPQADLALGTIDPVGLSSAPLHDDTGPDLGTMQNTLENKAFGGSFGKKPGERTIVNTDAYLRLQAFLKTNGNTPKICAAAEATYFKFLGVLDTFRSQPGNYDITLTENGVDKDGAPNFDLAYTEKTEKVAPAGPEEKLEETKDDSGPAESSGEEGDLDSAFEGEPEAEPLLARTEQASEGLEGSETDEDDEEEAARVEMPKRKQIFNPIRYSKELAQERERLAQDEGRESPNVQAIDEKLRKFEEFMKRCREDAESDAREGKNYSYDLFEGEDGEFYSEPFDGNEGTFTARQIFVSAVYLILLNFLFWAMWYQGAATFYQTLIEEQLNLLESIYCSISAVLGKMLLLEYLGNAGWLGLGNSLFNFLSAPIASVVTAGSWLLLGRWSYADLCSLVGDTLIRAPIGAFFALLTPNAKEDLMYAIQQKGLNSTMWNNIGAISNSTLAQVTSETGSVITNVLSVAGAFGFAGFMQRKVAHRLWTAFQPGGTKLERAYAVGVFAAGAVPVAFFAWPGMGNNFYGLGIKNFNNTFGLGNATPVAAGIPSGYIMMIYATASQGVAMWFCDTASALVTGKFDWDAFRNHNDQEYSVPVQVIVNGVTFIVTLGFTTTGMLTTLWQQVRSGQETTPFVRFAGATVATTIEFEPTYVKSKQLVEGILNYLKGLFRISFDDFTKRQKLRAISDHPEDDNIKCPVKHWVQTKEQAKASVPGAAAPASRSALKGGWWASANSSTRAGGYTAVSNEDDVELGLHQRPVHANIEGDTYVDDFDEPNDNNAGTQAGRQAPRPGNSGCCVQ